MRKTLSAVALFLLLAMGVVVNSLRPAPSVKARDAVGIKIDATNGEGPNRIYYYVNGEGPRVVLLASAGREASDFNELSTALASSGYRTIAVEAPNIAGNYGNHEMLFSSMVDYIATALEHDPPSHYSGPLVVIGHAYGNRLARNFASTHAVPDETWWYSINGTILLAAGGQLPMPPEAEKSLKNIFNPLRAYRSRMNDVRYAFFAGGNDIPPHWKRGWHTKTAIAQSKAVKASAGDDGWHCAGGVPVLIVQPMQDRIAPPENTYVLRDKCPQEIEIVEVQNAGHALLPEQPEAVAKAVLDFLAKHHPTKQNTQ